MKIRSWSSPFSSCLIFGQDRLITLVNFQPVFGILQGQFLTGANNSLRPIQQNFLFQSVYEHTLTGIAITDMHGAFIQCNHAFTKVLGYSEEAFLHMQFSELLHPEDRDANLAEVERLVAGEISDFEIENSK